MGSIKCQFTYWVKLNPTTGHEIKKERPCLVLSPTSFNNNAELAVIIPITTKRVNNIYGTQLKIPKDYDCVLEDSKLMAEQIKSVSTNRFGREIGKLPDKEFNEIKKKLNKFLRL